MSWLLCPSGEVIGIDHRLSKGLGRFLRQIVADAASDQPMLVSTREHLCVDIGFEMRRATFRAVSP